MKPLLVFYINVDNMSGDDIEKVVRLMRESIKDDKEYRWIILPVKKQPTKIECVNPIVIPTEYYEKYKLNFKTQIICKLKEISNVKSKNFNG